MDLKALLGDKYKEDMTVAEMTAALAEIDATAGYIKKDQFDKTASELAQAKKDLAAKMTDDETKKAQEEAERKELNDKYDALLKESTTSKHKASFLALGYDEKQATDAAAAFVGGETDKLFTIQKEVSAAKELALRAEIMKGTSKPGAKGGAEGDEKSDSETIAETIGKAQAETNKAAGDIISQYTGG